jgi:hypothetical protein
MQEIAEQIRSKVADEFTILVFSDNVEKTEVEIVYDPHIKNEHISWHQDQDKIRQFIQVDTSSSAFMGGKP